ncbi:MAG TPA: hypothetical protein VF006_09310 [Longimicrobium sp.]
MSHRILAAALLLCALSAACGDLPTGSDPQAQPGGASYDGGGFGIGGGGYVADQDEGYSGSGGATTTTSTTTSGESAERGGYTMGSGG